MSPAVSDPVSDPVRRAARRARGMMPATMLLLGASIVGAIVGGCAAPASNPPEAGRPGAVPAAADPALLASFAEEHGLVGLPRTVVRLGADTTGEGAALVVHALVAATPETRAQGLTGVAAVPEGIGMVFVFPEPSGAAGRPGFWMLDTPVALDIAFAAGGAIVGVATMQPCSARPCPVTHPGVDYDVALELAAGTLARSGIGLGDRFVWEPTGEAG